LSWSYNPTDLSVDTASGRLNSVRLLIGDTDTTDQMIQDEEVFFSLAQTNNSIYYAGSWLCTIIAAKFSRLVDTKLEGAGISKYGDIIAHYMNLSIHLSNLGKKTNGRSLGAFAGGISIVDMTNAKLDPDRVVSSFEVQEFDNKRAGFYTPDYFYGI